MIDLILYLLRLKWNLVYFRMEKAILNIDACFLHFIVIRSCIVRSVGGSNLIRQLKKFLQ